MTWVPVGAQVMPMGGDSDGLGAECGCKPLCLCCSGATWPSAFLKLHIISISFAAGFGKPLTAALMGKWWASGTSLQYYLFTAMWARPGADLGQLGLLGYLVQRPFLCALLSRIGLGWEVIAPDLGALSCLGFLLSLSTPGSSQLRASISLLSGFRYCAFSLWTLEQ